MFASYQNARTLARMVRIRTVPSKRPRERLGWDRECPITPHMLVTGLTS